MLGKGTREMRIKTKSCCFTPLGRAITKKKPWQGVENWGLGVLLVGMASGAANAVQEESVAPHKATRGLILRAATLLLGSSRDRDSRTLTLTEFFTTAKRWKNPDILGQMEDMGPGFRDLKC